MKRETVQDPVCGMIFEPDQAAAVLEWRGHVLHFCCASCMQAFKADPKRYLQTERGEAS